MKTWMILLFFLPFIPVVPNFAQGIPMNSLEQKAIARLNEKGISLDEFKERLLSKGLDYEQLSKLDPSEFQNYEQEINQVILELESEHKLIEKRKAPSAIAQKPIDPVESSELSKSEKKEVGSNVRKDSIIFQDSISKIWGHHLFHPVNDANFIHATNEKVPDHYILGPGDKVTINIWGISQLNEVYEIGQDGYINPTRMPRLFLKGLNLEKAKKVAASGFRNFYQFKDNQFDLSLNASRVIQVNIIGEVKKPGAYNLLAKNHAVNALFKAGGISHIGSVRNIKILRKGKEIHLDLYKYLTDPSVEKDFYLEENDYILVPVISKIVGIMGAVNRPAYYELKKEEDLVQLIQLSGGLKENAVKKSMQIDRFDLDKKIRLEAPYSEIISLNKKFPLVHGDLITVAEIKNLTENYVKVSGAVRAEMSFGFQNGWKVSDLLAKIEPTSQADFKNSYLLRYNPDNSVFLIPVRLEEIRDGKSAFDVTLKSGDELVLKKLEEFTDKSFVHTSGAIRNPGKYDIDANGLTTVNDLLTLSGGIKDNAWKYAYLFRVDSVNRTRSEIIRIDLQKLNQKDQNPILHKFDSLVVLTEEGFSLNAFVDISGAVKKPGRYKFAKGMSSFDLISLAQGFTYDAAPRNIEIFRVIMTDGSPTKTMVINSQTERNLSNPSTGTILEPFDFVVVRSQPLFTFQNMIRIDGEVLFPGEYALLKPNEKVSDVIRRAGGLTPEAFTQGATLFRTEEETGYVVMDMDHALENYMSRYNFILKNGDVISIPKQKDLVRIAGETNVRNFYPDKMIASDQSIAVAYHQNKRAKYYINKYGAGVNEQGDLNRITVEHANGRVEKTRKFLFVRFTPRVHKGSVILVGPKPIKKEKARKEKNEAVDWEKVLTKTLTATTAIFTMVLTYNSIVK
ncbi:MAG: SLBB domain-containing protein [Saprospiraceae bacterium]|nr:SLBB domain-containing protein [Saprospiraceae bacterium]